jgi:4-nitrophenyl phosphatase
MDLSTVEGLIVDMDGVLWRGDEPLPGLTRFFDVLRRCGVRFVLATNNPSRRPEGFVEKARRLGVLLEATQVVSSASVTLEYLADHYPAGTRVHVIGEEPLHEMVAEAGYTVADDRVAVVVAAMDRRMTYETLKRGTLLLRGGADFVATNPDASYPSEEGIVPGSGTMVAALTASSGRTPVVMGKPYAGLFDLALRRLGLPGSHVASLGDRLDADIAGGRAFGLSTILVFSGYTRPEDLQTSPVKPDLACRDISELSDLFEAAHSLATSDMSHPKNVEGTDRQPTGAPVERTGSSRR